MSHTPNKGINPINNALLKFVLLFGKTFTNMGASLPHIRAILTYKLIMDDRRPNTFQQVKSKKNKDAKITGQTWRSIILSALMGVLYIIVFNYSSSPVSGMFLYFSIYMFMLASSLITDFTSVLIDPRDNLIILPKPVADRTVVLARLLHILIHVSKLVVPMALPGIVFIGIKQGMGCGLSMALMIVFATLFTIFLVNALYIMILRFTTAAKFQNIISGFQIFLSVALYAFYQLAPKLLGSAKLGVINPQESIAVWLVPPYWFAASWGALSGQVSSGLYWLLASMALALPLVSVWVVIKYLAPAFNSKLSMISAASNDAENRVAPKNTLVKKSLSQKIAGLLISNPQEKMSFRFTWIMTSRSRDFKLKTYPSIGYLVVLFVMIFVGKGSGGGMSQMFDGGKRTVLFLIISTYLSSLLLSTVLTNIAYSEKYKAGWWYFITPMLAPGNIILGALKAVFTKFLLPICLLVIGAMLVLIAPIYYPNILLAILMQLLLSSLFIFISMHHFPFTQTQGNAAKGGSFLRAIFMLLFTGLLAILQYFILPYLWLQILFIFLVFACIWLLFVQIKRTTWVRLKSAYNEE